MVYRVHISRADFRATSLQGKGVSSLLTTFILAFDKFPAMVRVLARHIVTSDRFCSPVDQLNKILDVLGESPRRTSKYGTHCLLGTPDESVLQRIGSDKVCMRQIYVWKCHHLTANARPGSRLRSLATDSKDGTFLEGYAFCRYPR